MRAFPCIVVGCLLVWSATLSSLHARGTGGDGSSGASLILTDGQANGSLTLDGTNYSSFSGGAITGASTLTIIGHLSDGSLYNMGTLTKTGTADITLVPVVGSAGLFTLGDGAAFASSGTVNLGSGSTISFSNPLDGSSLDSGLTFNSGSVLITNAVSTYTSTAAITLAGTSTLSATGVLTLAPGSVVNAGGAISAGSNALLQDGLLTFGTGGTIAAGGTLRLGSGSILTSSAATVTTGDPTGATLSFGGVSGGTLTVNNTPIGTGTITLNGGNFGGVVLQPVAGLAPTFIVNANATLTITSANVGMAGQIVLSGGNPLTLNIGPNALVSLGQLPLIRNGAPGSAGTGVKFIGGALDTSGSISLIYLPAALDLAGDPLSLHFSSPNMHDKFVLQMSFNPSAAGLLGDLSKLYLAWFNPADNAWENAVNGDSDGGASTHFVLGAYDPSTDFNLGWYGVDTTTSTVWAVIDHNSVFGVANSDVAPANTTADGTSFATFADIPEPSSAALLLGGLGLLARRRRK